MTVPPALLTLEDVEVVYGAAIMAVRSVSLHVGQGEIVTLLGANGAGKTSTLRAVSNSAACQARPYEARTHHLRRQIDGGLTHQSARLVGTGSGPGRSALLSGNDY